MSIHETKLTIKKVKEALQAVNVRFRKTAYGDYRVVYTGDGEPKACYESSLEAALDSGLAMAKEKTAKTLRLKGE